MLEVTTIKFLKDLKKNNQKEWFDKNRKRYEAAKSDFEKLAAEVIKRVSVFDETIAHLQPKECLFRINRDVRFSKNKAPYKTNMAIYISRNGKKGSAPGYYFHCEPGKSFVAGGIWMPMPPDLKKLRQEIDYNWDDFKNIVTNKKFRSAFGDLDRAADAVLSRPPKGYEADNPAIEYLKLKSVIASVPVEDADLPSKGLAKKIAAQFEIMKPMIDFLNHAIQE